MMSVPVACLLWLIIVGAAHAADVELAPGKLPAYTSVYANPQWRGWPILPFDQQHYIRSGFLDPRNGYHFGVDISVDDALPDVDAPEGRVRRVYAIDDGFVRKQIAFGSCGYRRLSVGRFAYWHVDPTVEAGSYIRAGEPIGWSCAGEYHIHLSELQRVAGKKYWVNPLRPDGKLSPYVDIQPPVIDDVAFYAVASTGVGIESPAMGVRRDAGKQLIGQVQLRVTAQDPQLPMGEIGGDSRLLNGVHPYAMHIKIAHASGAAIIDMQAFQSDTLLNAKPETELLFGDHYAPGTYKAIHGGTCWSSVIETNCSARMVFNALATPMNPSGILDTRTMSDGAYDLEVDVRDVVGNIATASQRFCIDNRPPITRICV